MAGVNDGTASMLGAGLLAPGDAVDTGGASGGLAVLADRAIALPGMFSAPAPLPGRWVVGGAMAALGASVDWLRESVLGGTVDGGGAAGRGAAGRARRGRAPVPAVPRGRAGAAVRRGGTGRVRRADAGARPRASSHAPCWRARRSRCARVADPLAAAGAPIRELRLAGRRSPGDAWARIKADALGVPVAIPSMGESAVLGAAILAAAGVGCRRRSSRRASRP